jgi:hypothetical protein
MNGHHQRQRQTLRVRFPCHPLIPWPDALIRPMCADQLVPCGDNLIERRSPCLDGVCSGISELRWILRESESDRNDRAFDLKTFPFHGIQEYALYLPLVQGNLKWIARGRCCYIGYASYALMRAPSESRHKKRDISSDLDSVWAWIVESLGVMGL